MELTNDIKAKLAIKTSETASGGGFMNFRFAKKEWLDKAPVPPASNQGVVNENFVFKSGFDFVPVSGAIKEFDFNEEANDGYGVDAVSSTFEGMIDADEATVRDLVNSLRLNASDVYVLVDHCKLQRTYIFGTGFCCPAKLKIGFKSGKANTDMRHFPFKLTVEDSGLVPIYKGIGAISREFSVLPGVTALDVSTGEGTYVLPENASTPNVLTTLNNAQVDKVYSLKWASTTKHTTLADGAVFHLASAFTPATGAILTLRALKVNEFVEIGRYIPA